MTASLSNYITTESTYPRIIKHFLEFIESIYKWLYLQYGLQSETAFGIVW